MNSTVLGIFASVVIFGGGYHLVQYAFGQMAGYLFVGIVVGCWLVIYLVLRNRMNRLREDFAALPPEEKSRVLVELCPEIAEDLKHTIDKEKH